MGNGVGSERLKISSSLAWTSISPVRSLGFTFGAARDHLAADAHAVLEPQLPGQLVDLGRTSSSNTTWVTPSRSRRSMKTAPPWSRRLLTQPKRTTSLPTSAWVSSPQLWVRFSSVMKRGHVLPPCNWGTCS